MNPRLTAWSLCLLLAALLCGLWAYLPTLQSAPLLRISLFAALGVLGLCLVLLFPFAESTRPQGKLLIAALLLRLCLLPSSTSDDVHRYLWEGRLLAAGENPYAMTADAPARSAWRDADWEKMNHKDRLTAYPPGIAWIFAGTVSLVPHAFGMKVLALLGDLASLLLIFKILALRRLPLRWAGFYAFSPLALISFAAEAHFDSLMTAALLASFYAGLRYQSARFWFWLGMAVQIKLVCCILLPLGLVKGLRRHAWILLPVLILPAWPLAANLPNLWAGVSSFAQSGAFNAPLYALLTPLGLTPSVITLIGSALLLLAMAYYFHQGLWRHASLETTMRGILTALVVCSPITHFWYLAWLLPFAALRPSFFLATISISTAAYFTVWWYEHHHGAWGFGPAITALIWAPALLAALLQHRHKIKFWHSKKPLPPPRADISSLGIVIPIWNPQPNLTTLIRQLRDDAGPTTPIILADASPRPHGLDLSAISSITTLACPRGRGQQIAAGIAALPETCEWILIAHADTIPALDWVARWSSAVTHQPDAAMLVFGQRFTPARWSTLGIEMLNELRVLFGGVTFGDQTMILRRAALSASGGFPAQPLMEDVEVSLRLAHFGRIHYLASEWQVSAHKWSGPILPRALFIVRLLLSYYGARLRSRAAAEAASHRLYAAYYPAR